MHSESLSKKPFKILPLVTLLLITQGISGCSVFAVADAAVTVAATGVKVAAKTTGAVVDIVIPDGDDDEEKEDDKD